MKKKNVKLVMVKVKLFYQMEEIILAQLVLVGGFHHVKTPDEWLLTYEMSREITSISIRGKEIIYFFGCNGYKQTDVFLTRKEAIKEINKRNKKLQQIQDAKEALEVYEN